MNFTYGMKCPGCGEHNQFLGGSFGSPITTVNYNCDCGFSACLAVPRKGFRLTIGWEEEKRRSEIKQGE
jgi:hypothetical protein